MSDELKAQAAKAALDYVEAGMRLGLGSGSTANAFIHALAGKVCEGLEIICVPTSKATHSLAASLHIPLTTLEQCPALDLTIDGADEIDGNLHMIKGGGGALLREKIVASASDKMLVIADASKWVEKLGRFPLPVEVSPFGLSSTRQALADCFAQISSTFEMTLRSDSTGANFITDGGHYILDARLEAIEEPENLALKLDAIAGVMGHGLFINMADRALIASGDGVRMIEV